MSFGGNKNTYNNTNPETKLKEDTIKSTINDKIFDIMTKNNHMKDKV